MSVLVSTSSFRTQAAEFTRTSDENIVLIDGPRLGGLILRRKFGISVRKSYEVSDLDADRSADEER